MRNAIKNKIKILTALLVAFVLSMTMFGFTLFVGERAGAVSSGAELVSAIGAAPADYLTTTRIVIGTEGADSAADNGKVITIGSSDIASVTVPSGTRIVFSAVAPSAKKELEGNATYSRIIFDVPLIVEAEAEVVFDVDVEFNAAVTVNGTMELGGIARNRGAFTVSNEEDSHADIQSRGRIVSGSFNNDPAIGGSLTAESGASIVIEAPTTYTANSNVYSNNDGGALLLKANGDPLGLGLSIAADAFENGGSVIYESGATLPDSVTGTAVPAAFSTSTISSSVTVFYDGDFSRELTSGFATSLGGKTLLSFGRTTLKPSSGYFSVSGTASLGGGKTGSGAVFTQGANVLTLDGGAEWTEGKHSIPGEWWEPDFHSLYFLVGESADARTEYKNNGQSRSSALVSVSSNGTLDLYGGAEIVRSEVQKGETSGGGVKVTDGALNLYGGKIAYNAVTKSTNNGTGGGVFLNEGSTCTIYGGKITRNALANYGDESADGAGIAVNGGGVIIYGGEISYNCGAQGGSDAGADGGGVIAREGANVTMYGGSISCNWTGGFGGGVLLWQSSFTMDGGEMRGNYAAFGGAVGMTSGSEGSPSSFTMNGGTLSGNTAFHNTNTGVGGYGGGVCVGANLSSGDNYKYHSSATITGGEVSGNRAVYGGGMAIYTKTGNNASYLKMSGGTITGNTAYSDSTFSTVKHENGDGVYVYCESEGYINLNGGILRMSGAASIDSSNNVSFSFGSGGVNEGSTAPIQVTGELKGDRLAALVRIESESSWSRKDIVSYASGVSVDRDKFLLDSTSYSFVDATSALRISNSADDNAVAQVNGGTKYTTLAAAVAAASSEDTIRILKTATLTEPVTINKDLTILADGDYTLGVASGFSYGSVNNPALFLVENGATLTLGGSGSGTLTVDGNSSSSLGISLISVRSGGTYVQKSDVTLSNNKSNDAGGAIYNSGGTVTIEGGTIRGTTGAGGAIYNSGGTVNLNGGTIEGNKDTSGLSYGVYQTGETSILNLNGTLALSDKIYTAGVVNVNSGFTNDGGKIGVTFPAMWNAATVVVNVSKDYINGNSGAASNLLNVFEVYNMDEDYRLVVRDTNSVEANALVVGKSVTYVFYFNYQSGFEKEDVFTNGISFNGVQKILNSLTEYGNSTFESKIKTRQNAVVVEMDSGSSFDLSSMSLSGYVSMTGYTLIRWQVGSAAQDIAYNGTLAYQDSSAEIPVRSVWVANTYEISFDSNYNSIEGANADTVKGKVRPQTIVYSGEETTAGDTAKQLNANNFVAVGWVFTGWKTSDNDSVVYGDNAKITDEVLLELAKGVSYDYTLTDGKVTGAVYPITLRAQWQSIFGEGSGAGTAQAPFVIEDAADLAMLEATVNGDPAGGASGGYPYYNGHVYNELDEDGALSYTAESYEGYTFSLAGHIDSFGGVIGRVSAEGELAAHLNQEAELASTVYADIPSGQVAGTPFKGTFNGNDYSIGLAISRTIESGDSAGDALVGVGLFGYTDHAVIRDLTLTGSVVGYAHVGGLIGYAYGGTISGITNAADVSSGGHDVGGIIGTFFEESSDYTASSVSDVVNTGSVSYVPVTNDKTDEVDIEDEWNELGTVSDAVGIRYGGVVGSGVTLRLTGGYNTGAVTARYVVGGVVGALRSLIDTTVDGAFITQSFNTGTITATAGLYASVTYKEYTVPFITAYTGGVVGRIVGAGYVNYSFNSGSVTGTFVGKVDGGSVTKAEAPAVGSDDSGNYLGARGVGGIVGFTSYDLTSGAGGSKSISYVYNTGSVSAWSSVGGIAGYLAHSTIDYAFNGGNVTATGTHYDTASASRVAGGYNNAVAYLGAIVGRGVVATINSTVYYNTDSTYTGYTDNTVQAVGDTYYNAQLGTETNYSSALGLTSNQMSVPSENTRPGGFSANFQTTGWAYKYYEGEGFYHYPQLVVFAENAEKVGGTSVSDISKASAEITYKNEEGVDTPVRPTVTFKVSFVLGGGTFNFVGTDDNGSYFEAGGKRYTSSGDRWSYSVAFNDRLEQPEDPARVGYTFDGWYADPTFTKPFSFDSVPGSNVTVYAKWQVITYNIIYDNVSSVGGSIGGDYVSSFSSETTTRQYFPTDLSRRGYTLDHWVYYDSASGEEHTVESFYVAGEQLYLFGASEDAPVCTLSLSALPSSGLSLRAVWKATEYTVSYYDGEQILDFSDTYTIEQSRDLAAGPAKTGYTFKGWKIRSYDSADAVNNSLYEAYFTSGTALSQIYPNTVGDFALEAIYEVNRHTLYFNANGGTIENYESKDLLIDTTGRYYAVLEYGTSLARFDGLVLAAPEGKTFVGWYLNLNFEGNEVDFSAYTLPDSDITLYAKYDTATFVVTVGYENTAVASADESALEKAGFVKGDGGNWLLNDVEYGSDISGKLSDFVKALTLESGWNFSGWTVSASSIYNVKEAMTVTANYEQGKVTVNFVGFDKTTLDAVTITVNSSVEEGSVPKPSDVTGYTFKGWVNAAGQTVDPTTEKFAVSTTLYANYEPVPVTAQFYLAKDADEQLSVSYDMTCSYGSAFGSFPSYAQLFAALGEGQKGDWRGYRIVGWYTDEALSNLVTAASLADISNGVVDSENGFTVSLYAKLEYETYTINFIANGGSFAGGAGTASGSYTYGAVASFPTDPMRTGYDFAGWMYNNTPITLQDDETTYEQALLRMIKAAGATGTLNVVAQWNIKTFEVWYSAEEGFFTVTENAGGDFYGADGSTKVTQVGEQAKYFVVEVDYGKTPSVSLRPSRTGYAFLTYLDSEGSAVTAVTSDKYTKDSPICASYSIVTYTVTYITNGAGSIPNGTYTVENHITLPKPSYTGYEFDGWFTSSDFKGDALTSTNGLAQDLILYAKWTAKDVSFTLQITLPSEENVSAFAAALNEKLAGFDGLSVSAEGTRVTATFTAKYGADVSSLNTLLSGITVEGAIAGVWQKNDTSYIFTTVTEGGTYTNSYTSATGTTYTVTFKLDKEGENYLVIPVASGSAVSSVLNVTSPSRTGYTFAGWKTGTDDFALDSPINQDTIVWAEWTANTYEVTFNANGGTAGEGSRTVTFGAVYGDLPEPSRIGYTFEGWYLGDELVTKDKTVSTASDHALTAKWTAVGYQINFHFGESSTETVKEAYGTAIEYPDASRTYYTLSGWEVRKDGVSATLQFSYATMPDLNSEEFEAFRTVSEGVVSIEVYAVYTPITYSTTFEDHDGTPLGRFEVTVESDGGVLRAESPSRTGYTFLGWSVYYEHLHDEAYFTSFTIEEGTGENAGHIKIEGFTVDSDPAFAYIDIERLGEIHFVALYEANKYTVTLDANGGSTQAQTISVTYDGTYVQIDGKTAERTGYTFAGWYLGDALVTKDSIVSTASDHALTAQWTPNTYTVIFVSNGGEGEMAAQSFTYDVAQNLTQNKFTREGYTFAGWNTQADGKGTSYSNGQPVSKLTAQADGYVLLTAQWTANTYEVTFNANGGTVSPESTMVTFGGTYPKLPVPTREGYTFIGWFTAAAGGTQVTATTTVSTAKDHTLYAQWSVNGVVVTFDYAGADGNNATLSTTVQFGSSYGELPAPTRTGYTFVGWFTAKEGGSEVKSETMLENSAPHTLYAHWTPNTYIVTFNANGGSVTTPDKKEVTFGAVYGDLPVPTRTGYVFAGWFTQGGALVTKDSLVTATEKHQLTAYWTADTFTVTFDAGKGVVSPDKITVTFGGTYPKLPIPTRDGYTFVGWYNDKKVFESGDEVEITSDIKLTAEWETIGYSITYDLGGGTNAESNPSSYTIEDAITFAAPSRTGYTFVGWFDAETDGKKIESLVAGSTGNVTLYARWTAITYTVTFNANGGTGDTSPIEVTFGASYGELPIPTREGYTFAGWYLGDALVTKDTIVSTASGHALTAKWTPNTYLVIFNPNGGTGTMTAQSFTYGETQELSVNLFERTGYGFAGWNTKADGTGTPYSDKAPVSNLTAQANGSVTLYAMWSAQNYTITVDFGDGTYEGETEFIVPFGGNAFKQLNTPTAPENNYFFGWQVEGGTLSDLYYVQKSLTVTALYDLNDVQVVFFQKDGTTVSKTVKATAAIGELETATALEGYTFAGWFVIETNEKVDEDSSFTAAAYIEARYTPIEYTIIYNLDEGTNAASNPSSYTVESGQITFAAPSRTGYTFEGWFDAEGNPITKIDAGSTGNVTLYARWAIEEFTVTFMDGDETKAEQTVAYGGKATSVSAEKKGYTFLGWFDGEKEYDFASAVTKDMTLTAKWEIVEYSIIYNNLGGGTNAAGNPANYTVESGQIVFAAPSRTGYTFEGWFDAETEGNPIKNIAAGNTGNVTLYARWTAIGYRIGYNLGGGTADNPLNYNIETETFTLEVPTRTGYTFAGWTGTGLPAAEMTVTIAKGSTGDRVYTATWTANKYTVTLDANGGSTQAQTISVTYDGTYVQIDGKTAERTGYTFAGWYTDKTGGTLVTHTTKVAITDAQTLYAHWTVNRYTVTLQLRLPSSDNTAAQQVITQLSGVKFTALVDGAQITAPFTADYGTDLSGIRALLESDAFVRLTIGGKLYTLALDGTLQDTLTGAVTLTGEWTNDEVAAVTIVYDNGDQNSLVTVVKGEEFTLPDTPSRTGYTFGGWQVNGETTQAGEKINVSENVTVTAIWTPNEYEVTFDANGGAVDTSPIKVTFGSSYGELPVPALEGHTFAGWYFGDVPVTAQAIVKTAENHMLTAKWTANTYTVTFDKNGGTGEMAAQSFTYGEAKALTANAFMRKGYTFVGWNTQADGKGTSYSDGQTVSDLISQAGGSVTLYAVWKADVYTINYILGGGTNAENNPSSYTVESGQITFAAPSRVGYAFVGWFDAEEGGNEIESLAEGNTGNVTLYARWAIEEFTVTFMDGDETKAEQTVAYGGKATSVSAEKKGYTFLGWFDGEKEYDFASAVTKDMTLTAKWEIVEYTITYNLGGGTNAAGNPANYTVESGQIIFAAPSRTGYTFVGWFDAETEGTQITEIAAGNTGNVTLYARWAIEEFTVTFMDGDETKAEQTVAYGGKATSVSAEKKGYTFLGWFDGEKEYDFASAVTKDMTLTAKWEIVEYTITYNLGGGTNAESNPSSYTVESGQITFAAPSRTGYSFVGWFDAEEGGSGIESLAAGSTGNVTLYARWAIESYTVKFETNGGETIADKTVEHGSILARPDAVREGYLFDGWYADAALTQAYDFDEAVTKDMTLYAKWRTTVLSATAENGVQVIVTSSDGFDDGVHVVIEVRSSDTELLQGALSKGVQMLIAYDISLRDANGNAVQAGKTYAVTLSLKGLGQPKGEYGIVYIPDDYDAEGVQKLAVSIIGEEISFFAEHFSVYAIVDITPTAGIGPWVWILVAIAAAAMAAAVILIILRGRNRFELRYVNAGIPSVKLKESALIEMPVPEREDAVFEGWYYDEAFENRAIISAMPKENVVLYAKWRLMTEEERAAREAKRREEQEGKREIHPDEM